MRKWEDVMRSDGTRISNASPTVVGGFAGLIDAHDHSVETPLTNHLQSLTYYLRCGQTAMDAHRGTMFVSATLSLFPHAKSDS